MALKKETNQISFDDLEFEAEYEETRDYKTISGKEQTDVSEHEQLKMYDLDVGDEFTGKPEVTIFENKDRKYDSLRTRVIDGDEYLDLYANIPKRDDNGMITNIRKSFDFYRTCFDFIYSVLRWKNEANVVTKNGEEVNKFNNVKIENFAKYVDSMENIGVRIIDGNIESDYNSWIIYKME